MPVPGNPLRRLGAFLLDASLIGVLNGLLQPLLMILYLLAAPRAQPTACAYDTRTLLVFCLLAAIPLLFGFAYFTLFHACSRGAMPGKLLLGLQVVVSDAPDQRLSLRRSAARTLASSLCFVSIGGGYAFMLFDAQRRSMHDRIAGTRVLAASADLRRIGSLALNTMDHRCRAHVGHAGTALDAHPAVPRNRPRVMKRNALGICLALLSVSACWATTLTPELHPTITREYAGSIHDDLLAPPRY